jgi:transposase
MFKPINREIKEEILGKIKEGLKAPTLASQYGVSAKTIYGWLARTVTPEITFSEYQRVRRENEELKRIIGMMALDLETEKKRKVHKAIK